MKKMIVQAVLATALATPAAAQTMKAPAPTADLPALNDEFNSNTLTEGWKHFHEVEAGPLKY
jgi:hypothetical protein